MLEIVSSISRLWFPGKKLRIVLESKEFAVLLRIKQEAFVGHVASSVDVGII